MVLRQRREFMHCIRGPWADLQGIARTGVQANSTGITGTDQVSSFVTLRGDHRQQKSRWLEIFTSITPNRVGRVFQAGGRTGNLQSYSILSGEPEADDACAKSCLTCSLLGALTPTLPSYGVDADRGTRALWLRTLHEKGL